MFSTLLLGPAQTDLTKIGQNVAFWSQNNIICFWAQPKKIVTNTVFGASDGSKTQLANSPKLCVFEAKIIYGFGASLKR